MTSETSLSAYVQKCRVAFEEYCRLRSLGINHADALVDSGFYDAFVKPDQARVERDIKALQARNDD